MGIPPAERAFSNVSTKYWWIDERERGHARSARRSHGTASRSLRGKTSDHRYAQGRATFAAIDEMTSVGRRYLHRAAVLLVAAAIVAIFMDPRPGFHVFTMSPTSREFRASTNPRVSLRWGTRLPASLTPLDVAFSSVSRGYEVVRVASRLYVATTADGGRSWTLASPGLATSRPASIGAAVGVAASGAIYAYVVSASVVEVSSDIGHTWRQSKLPGAVQDVTSVGSSLWALVDGPKRPPSHRGPVPPAKGWLYGSGDYGRVWRRLSMLPSGVGPYTLLIRPTTRVAYALAPGESNTFAGRYGGLARTTNGAETWEVVQQPCDVNAAPRFGDNAELGGRSAKALWMVCSTNDLGVITRVYRSTDGATRWSLVAYSNDGNLPTNASAPPASPVATSVFSGRDAWLVLRAPRVLFSTVDAGRTWAQGAPRALEDEGPLYIYKVNSTIWVRTRTQLWQSERGHWDPVAPLPAKLALGDKP